MLAALQCIFVVQMYVPKIFFFARAIFLQKCQYSMKVFHQIYDLRSLSFFLQKQVFFLNIVSSSLVS